MKIGIVLDGRRSAEEIAALTRLAEKNGISQLWLSGGSRTKDHFLRLALAASRTRRIQLGPVAISPFEMHPVRIGLSLLTLDEMAGGRASIVLGGGGDLARTLDVSLRNSVRAVGETLNIVRLLDDGGEVNYRGRMFRVKGLFSPWRERMRPLLYVGANRPRMIEMAARKADGVMFTDMPLGYVGELVDLVRSGLRAAGRGRGRFRISNWFVWNVQRTEEEARRLALRTLGFRLYYIRDVAKSVGIEESEVLELEKRQPEMLRAIFQGRMPWVPDGRLADLLLGSLTITGSLRNLQDHFERLHMFEKKGLNEIALALEGDPVRAIRILKRSSLVN